MPRHSRVVAPNSPHHIGQRGHNRQPVFFTDNDRTAYLATLREFREKLDLQIHAYCLMTNHVHLIVNPGSAPANLGLLMKRLAGRHTCRLNRIKRRTGTSWEGRFKCSPIQSDSDLLACARYIDLNPCVPAWSSGRTTMHGPCYRAKTGLDDCPWLDLDPSFLALAPALSCDSSDIASLSRLAPQNLNSSSFAQLHSVIS